MDPAFGKQKHVLRCHCLLKVSTRIILDDGCVCLHSLQPRQLLQHQCILVVLLVHCRQGFVRVWGDLGLRMLRMPGGIIRECGCVCLHYMQPRELFQQQCILVVLLVHRRQGFVSVWGDLGLSML